jgi:hypothetical protein
MSSALHGALPPLQPARALWRRGKGGGVVEVGRWGFRRGTSPGVRDEEGSAGKGKSGDGEVLRKVGNKVLGGLEGRQGEERWGR